jgi:hypothetical protein
MPVGSWWYHALTKTMESQSTCSNVVQNMFLTSRYLEKAQEKCCCIIPRRMEQRCNMQQQALLSAKTAYRKIKFSSTQIVDLVKLKLSSH